MVPRYTRPEMAAIWSPENRYRLWFKPSRLAAADGMEAIGDIPPADDARKHPRAWRAADGRDGPMPIMDRIDAIEAETRHDVIAFLTWLAEGDRVRKAASSTRA